MKEMKVSVVKSSLDFDEPEVFENAFRVIIKCEGITIRIFPPASNRSMREAHIQISSDDVLVIHPFTSNSIGVTTSR